MREKNGSKRGTGHTKNAKNGQMTLSNDVRRVYIDRPTDHVISLEYLIYFTVLHCALAKFCQILLNEYCTVLYCTRTDPLSSG